MPTRGSQIRRDPQVMFVLGGTAQIVLITAIMAPLTYVAAVDEFPDAGYSFARQPTGRSASIGPGMFAMVDAHPALAGVVERRLQHDPLAPFCHSGGARSFAAISAHR